MWKTIEYFIKHINLNKTIKYLNGNKTKNEIETIKSQYINT